MAPSLNISIVRLLQICRSIAEQHKHTNVKQMLRGVLYHELQPKVQHRSLHGAHTILSPALAHCKHFGVQYMTGYT